jgi:hypothetical protein
LNSKPDRAGKVSDQDAPSDNECRGPDQLFADHIQAMNFDLLALKVGELGLRPYLSGGCLQRAVVAEALLAIEEGRSYRSAIGGDRRASRPIAKMRFLGVPPLIPNVETPEALP